MRSLSFYEQVVGLEPLRVEEFKAKKAAFPSVRLSPRSVIDLFTAWKSSSRIYTSPRTTSRGG